MWNVIIERALLLLLLPLTAASPYFHLIQSLPKSAHTVCAPVCAHTLSVIALKHIHNLINVTPFAHKNSS